MSSFSLLSNLLLAILLLSSIPPNFCQLALASSSYLGLPVKKPLQSNGALNIRDTRSRTLFSKFSDLRPILKLNSSAIESEIAAIFKNVAYGSSTISPLSKSTTRFTTTTVPTTTTREIMPKHYFYKEESEPKVFIGMQKEVYPNIPITKEPIVNEFTESSSEKFSNIRNSSAFTYIIKAEDYRDQIDSVVNSDISNGKTENIINDYPSFGISQNQEEEIEEEVQVRITRIKKKGYEAIQNEIGRAWRFHVYLTGIVFGIVAAVCLLSLSRISTCSNLLPRGYFITLHLMIFLASFLRCLLFLHDPYGAYNRLPSVLTSLLFNTVGPCLTTAYSVVLMVLLRAARFRLVPLNMQSPLVLATICGIHIGGSVVIDVSSGVLEDDKVISILNITTQVVTTCWGTLLCLGYVISFSSIEKAAQRQQGDLVRLTFNRTKNDSAGSLQKTSPKPSLTYAARIFLICTLLQGLLIAFIILNLVTTKVPISATSSEAWAWWTQASLERIIEISFSVLLLATALVLTQVTQRNNKEKDDKIFSIFSNCGRATKGIKNIDVYPVASEKCNILGNGTISHPSLNSSLNYSTNGWKQYQQQSPDHSIKYPSSFNSLDAESQKISHNEKYDKAVLFSPLQLIHASNTLRPHLNDFIKKEQNVNTLNGQPIYYTHSNNCSKTLPRNSYYCTQPALISNSTTISPKSTVLRSDRLQNFCKHDQYQSHNFPISNPQFVVSTLQCSNNRKQESDYEIAPYYAHSNASSASHTYSKPYYYYLAKNNAPSQQEYKSYRTYENGESKTDHSLYSSSQSEIHVDYLTDASSNDCIASTLSKSLTLPLQTQPYPQNSLENIVDDTPDSAVGLDFSPQANKDQISPHFNENNVATSKSIDFLGLKTTSLNDAIKGQSGFIGKIVNGSSTVGGYSPLNLDDSSCTISHSEVNGEGIKNNSVNCVNNDHLSDNSKTPPNKVGLPNSSVNIYQHNPVTCL